MAEFFEKGGWRADLVFDVNKNYCTLGGAVPTATPLLAVGAQVEVTNCQHQGQWSGIVDDVNAEARSYAIKYDDDHYESDVEAERVREEYAASPAQKKPCFGPSETLEAVESRFLGATLPTQ